jgi:hypothetical protein
MDWMAETTGFDSRQEEEILLCTVPTQPPIERQRGSFIGAKRPWYEEDHLPPSSAKAKNSCDTSILPHSLIACSIIKHKDNFDLLM